MQGANLTQSSMAHMIKEDHRDDESKKELKNIRSTVNNDDGTSSDNNRTEQLRKLGINARGVSIAYADADGGRQPILHNIANLFHLGTQSFGAFVEDLFGTGTDESSGEEGDDDKNCRNRKITCYCFPCLSFGRGEEGRSNVRAMSTLIFPLFLLSFFLLNGFGRVIMRNIRLRHGGNNLRFSKIGQKIKHPVLRRKTIHEYPGIKRELIWVPLEFTMNIGQSTSVEATMTCPRGVLFLFHGCSRYAASFFYSPQGQRLVSLAYKAGIAVVAFQKKDEKACWDWEDDGEAVLKIGKKFVASRLLGACGMDANGDEIFPPIWAFGASSGGTFITRLAAQMKEEPEKYSPFLFSAINVQIMSPPESLDWDIPTVFTVMDGDAQTKERVQDRVAQKYQAGPFKTIVTSGLKSIHANHFAKLFKDDPQMTPAISVDIYQSLVTMGIVDPSKNDQLSGNPRQRVDAVASIWEKYDMEVRGAMSHDSEDILPFGVSHQMLRPLREDEVNDANSIWLIEELNVAWDKHEITAEGFEDVLAFFFEYGIW